MTYYCPTPCRYKLHRNRVIIIKQPIRIPNPLQLPLPIQIPPIPRLRPFIPLCKIAIHMQLIKSARPLKQIHHLRHPRINSLVKFRIRVEVLKQSKPLP